MDGRTKLKNMAFDVNSLLSEYIIIHDKLIKKSNSFFSIFTSINFNELSLKSAVVLSSLKSKHEEIISTKNEAENDNQKQFFECLSEYTHALINTVDLLHRMLQDLDEKSKGGKLSLKQHVDNNKQYKDSIDDYMSYGVKLNSLYQQI